MLIDSLPLATPYDPAEDPPGSIDPMGTVAMAEQLAEVLFPGVTARMWRARHMTFAALAALVAEHVAEDAGGDEELRLEARLGLERLFVSAVARSERWDDSWRLASRRLPGISLARRALNSKNQPLERANFLKGQAVNGPFGVIARLARNMDVIDDDNRISRNGQELLLAWSAEEGLRGILDDRGAKSPGAKWLKRLTKDVARQVKDSFWPAPRWWGWSDLAEHLRPDHLGHQESDVILRLLCGDKSVVRRRCVELLQDREIADNYVSLSDHLSRGEVDQHILAYQVQPKVDESDSDVERIIAFTIRLLDAYEQTAGHLESVVRGLLWGLTHRGGRADREQLLADPTLKPHFAGALTGLASAAQDLQSRMADLPNYPVVNDSIDLERLDETLQDALGGLESEGQLVDTVMARHRRVQKQKSKGAWIETDTKHWTLLPGFGDSGETPWTHDGAYLHPFRVSNAYSLLIDLGQIHGAEITDGQEE